MDKATKYYWVDVTADVLVQYNLMHSKNTIVNLTAKFRARLSLLNDVEKSLATLPMSPFKECTKDFNDPTATLEIPNNKVIVTVEANDDNSYRVTSVIVSRSMTIEHGYFSSTLKNMKIDAEPAYQAQAAETKVRKRDVSKRFASSGLSWFKAKEPAPKTPSGLSETQQELQNFQLDL